MTRNRFIYFGGLALSILGPQPALFLALAWNAAGPAFLLGMMAGLIAVIGGAISARA